MSLICHWKHWMLPLKKVGCGCAWVSMLTCICTPGKWVVCKKDFLKQLHALINLFLVAILHIISYVITMCFSAFTKDDWILSHTLTHTNPVLSALQCITFVHYLAPHVTQQKCSHFMSGWKYLDMHLDYYQRQTFPCSLVQCLKGEHRPN